MKSIILLFGLAMPSLAMAIPSSTIVYVDTSIASNEVIQTAPLSTSTVALVVKDAQERYGLGQDFYDTMQYESAGFQNIQSKVPNPNGPNGRENSWGIPQINLDAHPEVSKEQALNIRWAVDWAAQRFQKGYQHEWTAWRDFFKKEAPDEGSSS